MPDVAVERTRWRDLTLNDRHRLWGWDCPAVDIDCLFMEYDQGRPCAVVEFKNEHAREVDLRHPSIRALDLLATNSGIPFLLTRYADDFSWWLVTPINAHAKQYLATAKRMTEAEYIIFQYQLRGYAVEPWWDDETRLWKIRRQRALASKRLPDGSLIYPFVGLG